MAIGVTVVAAVELEQVAQRLQQMPPTHPRLFLPAVGEVALQQQVRMDPLWQKLHAGLLREARRELATQPVERVLIGRRLLDKSNTALSRVLHLGLAWRLTGERQYFERGRTELIAISGFADWNPDHFLDVAVMTEAAGIGYDWFYTALDEPARRTIRQAIVEKGLKASQASSGWSRRPDNWNQVCNGGITVGALAVAESEPNLVAELVTRAVNTVPIAMHEYGPDGAYPEGPGYWGFGTTYNVILISALRSALGTDFGLAQQPGFLSTGDYYLHVVGPTGLYFNYSDCRRGGQGVAAAMFWFAAQRQKPYLLWNEWADLERAEELPDPWLMLWFSPAQSKPTVPSALSWAGQGRVPVAFHRSSWTTNASYVAIKGGTPLAGHAHMDVGTFVMDADGVRWADDLGLQEYNSLESKGINLWSSSQDAGRWEVFRLGTSSHNVLMVDGQQQRVTGRGLMLVSRPDRTVMDNGSVYQGQLNAARRGVALRPDRTVLVQDEVTALDRPATVRWAMVTRGEVDIKGPGRATLRQGDKTLSYRVIEPATARLRVYPTSPPPAPTDAPNEGTRMLGFEVAVPAREPQRIVVHLVPQSASTVPVVVEPLADW